MPSTDKRWTAIRQYVEVQRNYLRNPLPPHPWICPICRGVRTEGYPLCFRCQSHRDRSGGVLADLVVPISYSPRTGQHHHNLRTYKGTVSSEQAQWSLLAVLLLFLHDHVGCLAKRTGAALTHVTAVPSTRRRPGQHPLASLVGSRLDLPWIASSVNPQYGPDDREFHPDWFTPTLHDGPVHALIIEDTWTTGARAQSLAYALKTAGAATVATVVLGRHVDTEYPPSKRLLSAITGPVFDTTRCSLEDRLP
ncbi:phosphoribosyltransferase [Phytohabitans kaempferiae]|uniref:Phosphoribosyltransferase n=1 Tax=Phytohabitans kaempferiae TaxID=1620943 RepID=A0ABV6LWB7_9ACTN